MGLDAASSCTSSDFRATLQGPAARGIENRGCATLPACPESPLPSSEFSTSSSSTSETSAGASILFERSGAGDTTSAVSTISSKKDPSLAQFDSNGLCSSPLNIPSTIFEEDLEISMCELEESDGISKDLDLDMKPCFDDMCPTDERCQVDSGCDGDMLLSRLDKLLDSDSPQEAVDESGLFFMNDLFPDLSCPQDFCPLDEMSSFPAVDNFRGFEPSSLSTVEEMVAVSSPTSFVREEESVSQVFAQWLQSNAHRVSLSDLRKIKLKTSTIENATRRLGGGKKGLMLFLRFVLMWVQKLLQNAEAGKQEGCESPTLHSEVPSLPSFKGTVATCMQGASKRHTFASTEASDVSLDVQARAQPPFSGCVSSQGPQSSVPAQANLSSSISSGYTSISNGGAYSPLASTTGCGYSSFPNTNFYQCNSQWLPQANGVVHGGCPTSLQPPLQPLAPGIRDRVGGARSADSSTLTMSSQQRHCTDANPAATFRAARKNRMERQRWSVRRNRKWAASNQHQHLGAVTSSNGYAHSNVAPWPSQSLANGSQKLPYLTPQSRQPFARGTSAMDHQQSKRQEKNLKLLFHKELKQSDVGALGRIVLPKAAETCLPPLELRDGVNLVVEDINTNKIWKMRYRFWPNNKSRMYLLENTSDFVKLNDLKEGDYMMMYLDSHSNKYVIRGVKGTRMPSGALPACNAAEARVGERHKTSSSKEEASGLGSFAPDGGNCEDSCDDSLLVDLIEQSLEDF